MKRQEPAPPFPVGTRVRLRNGNKLCGEVLAHRSRYRFTHRTQVRWDGYGTGWYADYELMLDEVKT
jgi:hypothetical protein